MNTDKRRGTRRNAEKRGETRRNAEKCGETRRNAEERGGTRRNAEERGGMQRTDASILFFYKRCLSSYYTVVYWYTVDWTDKVEVEFLSSYM
jgi:hypothetical protein